MGTLTKSSVLLVILCLTLGVNGQESTYADRFYASLQLGAAPMAEPAMGYDPDFFTFRDFISIYRPTVGLSVGRKFKRFRLEAGLEYFQFELANQRHTATQTDKFYLYQYDTRGFLLALPLLVRWHFGKQKLRLGLDAGIQFHFMQHRISEGTAANIDLSSFPMPASEPYKESTTNLFALPLPRLGAGLSYAPQKSWEYGMRLGMIGIPGFDLLGYLQLMVVRPF